MEKLTKQNITNLSAEELDQQARDSVSCLGCGQHKDKGLVVCWNCFKYTLNKIPFKDYYGDIKQWALTHSYLMEQ